MRLVPTEVHGAFVVELTPVADERGWFARTFDAQAFSAAGFDSFVAQCSLSRSLSARTLRGLHYQRAPVGESKLVRCTRGRIFDVAVDLRPNSPTFRRWTGVELDADNGKALAVPAGCAHGFLTLDHDSEVAYQISTVHQPDAAAGLRWDDPGLEIAWPVEPIVISARDRSYPNHDWTVPSPDE